LHAHLSPKGRGRRYLLVVYVVMSEIDLSKMSLAAVMDFVDSKEDVEHAFNCGSLMFYQVLPS
tara:strand:+ start:141 stop:329 length:189 start_codon:yes stop_codon:yes gene_type:complete